LESKNQSMSGFVNIDTETHPNQIFQFLDDIVLISRSIRIILFDLIALSYPYVRNLSTSRN
jgi:hypothetical protein